MVTHLWKSHFEIDHDYLTVLYQYINKVIIMPTNVNPVLDTTALLIPQMPGVYRRAMIYDPTWADSSYDTYSGTRIVPALGSVVQDTDDTPLWVIAVDSVTHIPTYTHIPLTTENDNVVSLLNYGNSTLRLYVDTRALPYPATVDSKCIFLGKAPRFYTLSRYPGTSNETIISQYFDNTGTLVSTMVPLVALDSTNSSWYLPRCHISHTLDINEEVKVKIFTEDGAEVYSALLFAKESTIINEDVMYNPTIVGMTVTGNQKLSNGTLYLYEKQNFSSLGIKATLVYSDGSTVDVPLDGQKCILYGQNDFISSFAGLLQYVTVKYFRSTNEAISSNISDPTGQMISVSVPVTVVPNTLGTTTKIVPVPIYNTALSRYIIYYYMYFGDGRSHIDVSGYVTTTVGGIITDSSYFGVSQSYSVSVDMSVVDPVHYPTSVTYTQNITIQFGPPGSLVKWWFTDSLTSPLIYGQDNSSSRRPVMKYDTTLHQYFVPSNIFVNSAAFVNSFYTKTNPPYDPSIAQIPTQPTHFVIRDTLSGLMITAAPIVISAYAQAFNLIESSAGNYKTTTVVFEFVSTIAGQTRVLFGGPVDVSTGTYVT
jgi:hypothetical protein